MRFVPKQSAQKFFFYPIHDSDPVQSWVLPFRQNTESSFILADHFIVSFRQKTSYAGRQGGDPPDGLDTAAVVLQVSCEIAQVTELRLL